MCFDDRVAIAMALAAAYSSARTVAAAAIRARAGSIVDATALDRSFQTWPISICGIVGISAGSTKGWDEGAKLTSTPGAKAACLGLLRLKF